MTDDDLGPYPTAITCPCGQRLYVFPPRYRIVGGVLRHRDGFACPHRARRAAELLPTVGQWGRA